MALDSGFAMAWRKLAVVLGNPAATRPPDRGGHACLPAP